VAVGRLHGGDDAVDADDAVPARRFGYRQQLHRRGAAADAAAASPAAQPLFEWVLAMRVVEGLAAGVLQPIPAIIILHAFEQHEQGKAMGIFGMGVVLAPALGPEHRRRAGRGVRLALDLLRRRAVLCCRARAGRTLPAARRAGRRPVNQGGAARRAGLALLAVAVLCGLNGLVHLHEASRDRASCCSRSPALAVGASSRASAAPPSR
jgi:hypothetical protein